MKKGKLKTTVFWKCVVCGKITAGRIPRDGNHKGDGTVKFPRRHNVDGKPCEGNIEEAELIEISKPPVW